MLFVKALKDVLGYGALGGLLVALIVATATWSIDKLFALSLPAFTTMSRWSFVVWLGLVILDAVREVINNYFASEKLARVWKVSQFEVIDAVVNHGLAKRIHAHWTREDFLRWYHVSQKVRLVKFTA